MKNVKHLLSGLLLATSAHASVQFDTFNTQKSLSECYDINTLREFQADCFKKLGTKETSDMIQGIVSAKFPDLINKLDSQESQIIVLNEKDCLKGVMWLLKTKDTSYGEVTLTTMIDGEFYKKAAEHAFEANPEFEVLRFTLPKTFVGFFERHLGKVWHEVDSFDRKAYGKNPGLGNGLKYYEIRKSDL